jgi:hypothetical protein
MDPKFVLPESGLNVFKASRRPGANKKTKSGRIVSGIRQTWPVTGLCGLAGLLGLGKFEQQSNKEE